MESLKVQILFGKLASLCIAEKTTNHLHLISCAIFDYLHLID
jgi:hypothetical protein